MGSLQKNEILKVKKKQQQCQCDLHFLISLRVLKISTINTWSGIYSIVYIHWYTVVLYIHWYTVVLYIHWYTVVLYIHWYTVVLYIHWYTVVLYIHWYTVVLYIHWYTGLRLVQQILECFSHQHKQVLIINRSLEMKYDHAQTLVVYKNIMNESNDR